MQRPTVYLPTTVAKHIVLRVHAQNTIIGYHKSQKHLIRGVLPRIQDVKSLEQQIYPDTLAAQTTSITNKTSFLDTTVNSGCNLKVGGMTI